MEKKGRDFRELGKRKDQRANLNDPLHESGGEGGKGKTSCDMKRKEKRGGGLWTSARRGKAGEQGVKRGRINSRKKVKSSLGKETLSVKRGGRVNKEVGTRGGLKDEERTERAVGRGVFFG